MKWLSDRISFHRHDEYTTILISTKVEKWKEGLLLGWMVLWSLAGMAMLFVLFSDSYLTQLSTNTPKNQLQLFLVLFLVFWAYYLYKIVKVYIWRNKGVEYFKLDTNSLVIKRAFGKIGKANSYKYENMGGLKLVEASSRSFGRVMQSAFWDIGNETLQFEYHGKQIIFGVQLESEETNKMKQFLNSEISKFKKKSSK